MRLVVLGSGTSFGIPQIGCDCEVCTSDDPRDRRTRVGAVVEDETGERRILIDTPPELRLQLVSCGIPSVDAVIFTHEHADHVHGIDDLRALSARRGDALPVYGSLSTLEHLRQRFTYIFDSAIPAPPGSCKPELEGGVLTPGRTVEVAGMDVLPLELEHGPTKVLGFRIGRLGYLTDVKRVSQEAMEALRGISVLVLNALFDRPHPTHLSFGEAVGVAQELGVERTLLTHLTHRFRHLDLLERLPEGVEPAHDGLVVDF